MAYLNFSELAPAGAGVRDAAMIDPAALDSRAWTVIRLARRDGMASLADQLRFGRLRAMLFGTRPASKLADPQLEAVRRVAVHAWQHGYAVPEREVAGFLSAGHTLAQLETLVTWIDAQRG
ncbi:MAG TPA: hypothetical protein VF649_11090 [Sphingomonas sp.]|jgi:hypothetical protein|uniref:hypothetical protein n=1 Tax=Sphingomonas sp. TaxID=28214 RepID=UPI002EDB35C0